MRSPCRGSRPFVAETSTASRATRSPTAASTLSTKCDGTATRTVLLPARASPASAVTVTPSGSAAPGR